jgi:saccharopine dehydrogenase (NAD+, L-lysine-forming)
MNDQTILVAGGYGVVGQRIAADLASDYTVIVAGRHIERATAMATAIGHGAIGRQLDVTNDTSISEALDGVATVVSCIDQPRRQLLHASIARGLSYTDITPHLVALGRGVAYDNLGAAARTSGARVVLGTGIVPGISNVMVRALSDALGGTDTILTSLLLSAHDVSGPASLEYFAKELTMPFNVYVNGTDVPTRPFSDPIDVNFPAPFGRRPAYLFPFSDQILYPLTMGAKTIETRLAIEPPRVARFLAFVTRIGAAPLLERAGVRRAFVRRGRHRASIEQTQFALRVDVRRDGRSTFATLLGPEQAQAAAAGAAATVRELIEGKVPSPGVWMPEQVIEPLRYFSRLTRRGLTVNVAA